MSLPRIFAALVALALLAGCGQDIVPVRYGRDECAYCKMTVVDPRFGGELITAKGRAFVFDDVGCLLRYLQANPAPGGRVYVADFAHPATLLPAETAAFLAGDGIRSPMASGIAAFGAGADREHARQQFTQAQARTWADLPKTP